MIKTVETQDSNLHQAHDAVVKSVMSDLRVARDVLSHLPEAVKQKVNLDTLQLRNGTFIDPELRALHTDILYSVDLVEHTVTSKNQGFIYVHVEHQSEADPLIAWRMIKYCVRIIEKHLAETKSKILAEMYMFNHFHLIDLNTIPDEEIRQREWSCLLEMLLKHIRARDIMTYLEQLSEVFSKLLKVQADNYVMSMLKYLIIKADIKDREKFLS